MGSVKEYVNSKVEAGIEQGDRVKENAENKIEEANVSAEALSRIEGVDDDDVQAVESARAEANSEARRIAEDEIRSPSNEINRGFTETAAESNDFANKEHTDAAHAAEMVADYSGTGSNLSSTLEQSAAEFEHTANNAEQARDQLDSAANSMSSQLTSTFG